MVRRCCVNFQCGDVLLIWRIERQRLIALGVSAAGGLVGCFGFNGPLRQYFSLYRAVAGGCLDIFFSWLFSFSLSGKWPNID